MRLDIHYRFIGKVWEDADDDTKVKVKKFFKVP